MAASSMRIFISYARSDAAFVLRLAQRLRADGRSVWIDQLDIPKGARWDEEIGKALESCSCQLVVLSPAAIGSQNVMDEVSFALDERKTVIPILHQACTVPFRLKRVQYVDFTGNEDDAYAQLLDAIPTPAEPATPPVQNVAAEARPVAGAAAVSPPPPPPTAPPPPPSPRQPAPAAPAAAPVLAPSAAPVTMATADPPPPPVPGLSPTVKLAIGGGVAVAVLAGYLTWGPKADALGGPAATAPAATPTAVTPTAVTPTATTPGIETQMTRFVTRYLEVQGQASPAEVAALFADRVDYYDQHGADRAFIVKDKTSYYRRWPQVRKTLVGPVTVSRNGSATTLSFTSHFEVANPERGDRKSGTMVEELVLSGLDQSPRIVSVHERAAPAGPVPAK